MYLILKKVLERTVQEDRIKTSRLKHSLVVATQAQLYANLKGSVSCMNLIKNGIEMTFKNKANSWTNWHRSVVSCFMAKKTFFLTFSSLIRLVCTQMLSCAHGDEYVFVGQSHIVFFWFFQRLVIPGADQKDHSLWERDCWEHSVMSLRLNLSYEGREKLINFTFDTDLARDFLGF